MYGCFLGIFLLKETSVVSIVALADLMSLTKDMIGLYYKTNEALLLLVVGYLALLLPRNAVHKSCRRPYPFYRFRRNSRG